MNQRFVPIIHGGRLLCAAAVLLLGNAWAATTSSGLNLASVPLYVTTNVAPIVMLNVTKDHQLYYKAYNDYTDLDSDGAMDTSYKHAFNYYGYFDYGKCYKYDATAGYYVPFSVTADKYCTSGDNQWSGNFLNWLSMSRIDVLRKVLYGGTRYIDTASSTVLERTLLPTDAHAWVKYYNHTDINRLTPFSPPSAAATFSTSVAPTIWGTAGDAERSVDVPVTDTGSSGIDAQIGDQVTVSSASGTRVMKGMVTYVEANVKITLRVPSSSFVGPVDTSEGGNWTLTNHTRAGASFCNVTYAYNTTSQAISTASNPPLIRAVRGDYSLWAANERQQCLYASERGDTLGGEQKNNGNRIGLSGMAASAKNPPTARGLYSVLSSDGKPDFIARVQVCVAALIGNESCRRYDTSNANNLKPIGLLQEFGEGSSPAMRFGLVTGSYDKNISGGVLRRAAMASLSKSGYADNEIDPANGMFTTNVGIVRTIDRLRMYGYQYFGGDGVSDGYMTADSCNYQQMGMVTSGGSTDSGNPANEGNCSTWGNPIGEIYLESLRYLAGQTTPTSAYYAATATKDSALGLPRASWSDPISSDTYCTPLTAMVVNSSSITFDDDQYAGVVDIGSSTADLVAKTNVVGAAELNAGQQVSVGDNGTTNDGVCTSKTFGTLGALAGICPESPALKGTYKIAGLAYRARTNPIRSFTSGTVPANDSTSLKVSTYAVQLASATPVIKVNVNGKPVVITPAYRLERGGRVGGGTLVDFRPIGTPGNTSGKFYLAWEDSSAGGDYDQDVWGLLSYTVSGNTISVRTAVIAHATENPQGFGYTIQGTDKDGLHFYSGILDFNFTDASDLSGRLTFDDGSAPVAGTDRINSSGGCRNCWVGARAITARFTATSASTSALELKDPLYYAAKWGGFTSMPGTTETASDTPNSANMRWDTLNNLTGAATPDTQPDQYFYVINPTKLQDALRTAFKAIMAKGSSSGVAANSYSLNTDNSIYLAGFNSAYWSGYLKSEPLGADGSFTTSLTDGWNTDTTLTSTIVGSNRIVYTFSGTDGIDFTWNTLDVSQKAILNGTDALGERRLNFLRGSAADEGTLFRSRKSLLGDIVNSSPLYVGFPIGRYEYPLNLFNEVYLNDTSYSTWSSSKMSRQKMLYVGANDGMLHGFNASTGVELMTYIPGFLFNKLPALTALNYSHQYTVDGSPTVADVKFAAGPMAGWHSVLVSGVGAGGRGVFALDVSDPAQYTAGNAAAIALWEFTSSNDADLGYTLSKPLIVKLNNGKWAAIFGNGYFKSGDTVSTGRAKLFILDIEAGADGTWSSSDFRTIDTGVGSTAAPNGLGQVVAYDNNLDGIADEVYGGDLYGNLWKFDLTSSSANSWDVAYKTGSTPKPLITVCADPSSTVNCNASLLPITQRPTLTFHPTSASSKMVYFGTGKYLEQTDQTDTTKGWVFGVWDNNEALGLLSSLTAAQQNTQTITTLSSGNRDVTDIAENWATHKLWREQLPTAGERMSGTPRLLGGVLFYTTYIPSSAACTQTGTGYLMGVRFQNGGRVAYSVFDSNGDGQVTTADSTLGGISINPTLGDVALIKTPGRGDVNVKVYSSGTDGGSVGGGTPLKVRRPQGRVSWRELFRE